MPLSTDITAEMQLPAYTLNPEIVLTPDGPLRGKSIQVEGQKIVCIADSEAGQGVDLEGYAIAPGFIDAHTHAGQTFGKSLIGGEPAQIWKRIWNPMEAAHDANSAYYSAKWMFFESLRGGFTTLVNFSMNNAVLNEAVHKAAAETGIRLISASGLNEYDFVNGQTVTHSFDEISSVVDQHIDACADNELITPSICSTSFHTNSDFALQNLAALCIERGIKLQIHSNEHFPEVHDCVTTKGKRPIEFMDSIGILGPHLLLHHTTLVTDKEIEILARTNTSVSYNPLASIWKGNAVAPALAFSERGVTFGIGSDTTSADAFKNLCAAEACQRVKHSMPVDDFSAGAAWTWTNAASKGSAIAAGISHHTGSIAEGFEADFLVLDMYRPECLPSHDFEWEFVRYYSRDQISAAVVSGKLLMVDGLPVSWDEREFMRDALAAAPRVTETPGLTRVHGPSGDHRPLTGATI